MTHTPELPSVRAAREIVNTAAERLSEARSAVGYAGYYIGSTAEIIARETRCDTLESQFAEANRQIVQLESEIKALREQLSHVEKAGAAADGQMIQMRNGSLLMMPVKNGEQSIAEGVDDAVNHLQRAKGYNQMNPTQFRSGPEGRLSALSNSALDQALQCLTAVLKRIKG